MFFGRNEYDTPTPEEEHARRIQFLGARSISSNQFFGRDEPDDAGNTSGTEGGLLGDGSFSGLETAARETIARVLASPEVQNVGETIRSSALKLSDYLAQMSER